MKGKKSREERYKHKITRRCVIEKETKELKEKPLHCPPSGNWSTRQSIGMYGLARDPPSLLYPMYLSPLSSYSNKAFSELCLVWLSRSHNKLHFASTILGIFQCFPVAPKTLSTLWKGVGCIWVQISSQGMTMGEGRRRSYNDFSLRMSSSLSKRWVCVL